MSKETVSPNRRPPGRPAGPQREASGYILGAVNERPGIRERDLRARFPGGHAALTRNVTGLVAAGWLQSREASRQCDRTLTLGPQAGHVIGIGVSREMLRCGIYRADGSAVVSARTQEVIFPAHGAEALHPEAFHELLTEVLASCRRGLRESVYPVGCGVAWPSRVARANGEPQHLSNRQTWINVSVKKIVAEALRAAGFPGPVLIINDADAEAVAESRLGVVKDAHTALVVKIAGGLGAAIVHNGTVLSGARGFAGELGHVPLTSIVNGGRRAQSAAPDVERTCSCGTKGHLQTVVSIAAVVDRLAPGLALAHGSYLAAIAEIERTISSDAIDAAMYESGVVLGRALCAPVAMLNPDMVVLRPAAFPSGRLVSAVLEELRAALLDVPTVRLGTQTDVGRWMGAQGAALVVGDQFALPRVLLAQHDWRSVEALRAVAPIVSAA